MARRRRLPDAIVLRCAAELRAAGSYRGRTIHAGRGRPPAGQVGFVDALARRTGYSRTIVMRVLAARTRAGPRRTLAERLRGAVDGMTRDELAQAVHELYRVAAGQVGHGAAADPLVDERLPAGTRLQRLVEVLAAAVAQGDAPAYRSPDGGIWRDPPAARPVAPAPDDPRRIVIEACHDALHGLLDTPGALPDAESRTVVQGLLRRLGQPPASK